MFQAWKLGEELSPEVQGKADVSQRFAHLVVIGMPRSSSTYFYMYVSPECWRLSREEHRVLTLYSRRCFCKAYELGGGTLL